MEVAATPSRLRPGQREALSKWAKALRAGERTELVVVPVGYGKTVIGIGSFEVAANTVGVDTCLYLTPTDVLRSQVYGGVDKALGVIGSSRPIRKALADNAAPDRIRASAANFIVATYQQVIASPAQYRRLCQERRVHIVCDEAHHLGERGRWGAEIMGLGALSAIMLSATPVRLDREPLAGVRYEETVEGFVVDPMVAISMRQAWKERRILKHLNMQMKDYSVQLRDGGGEVYEFTASEMADLPDFDQRCVRQQLRWNDDYVEPLVREFAISLLTKMQMAPKQHQGLVFAATTEHANHLYRVFARSHPSLRCAVVHSGDIADGENDRRLTDFHAGKYDVLIQVRKASEGFDAPTVSVLLKLDSVHSREPVIQQLGRGLRYNHNLSEAQNLLNVFIGRDPRLAAIIEHLEREAPPPPVRAPDGSADPGTAGELLRDDDDNADSGEIEGEDEESTRPEIVDVVEAGDAYLDHTGRFVEGQQLTMFGVLPPPISPANQPLVVAIEVVDIDAEMREAVEYCKTWTNRAARERARRVSGNENHHAALNLAYAKESGRKGSLSTPSEYRAKGDWMRHRYMALLG